MDQPDSRLARFVAGDTEAFESLYRDHAAAARRWVRRIVRDDSAADDVVAETFWRVYRARARMDASRPFGAWLRRIATNVALDHLRGARRRAREAPLGDREVAAVDGHAARDAREAVVLAFRRLSPRLQIAATLALVEREPYADIAAALGIPVGTVKSRVARAERALRAELARLGIRP